MIAECKGATPDEAEPVLRRRQRRGAGSLSAFGPMNTQYSTTSRNGTGVADIQLLTAEEAPQLGCNRGHECSLVIEPAQGGNLDITVQLQRSQPGPRAVRHRASTPSVLRTGNAPGGTGSSSRSSSRRRPPTARCTIPTSASSDRRCWLARWARGRPHCARSPAPSTSSTTRPRTSRWPGRTSLPGTDDVALTTLPLTGTGERQAPLPSAGCHLGRVSRVLDR